MEGLTWKSFNRKNSRKTKSFPLSKILRTVRRDASDLRDRIIAFLGMSEVSELPNFRPNYSWSMECTYVHYTRQIIFHEGSLQILADADCPRNDDSLPTWVRDWRLNSNTIRTIFETEGYSFRYSVLGQVQQQLVTPSHANRRRQVISCSYRGLHWTQDHQRSKTHPQPRACRGYLGPTSLDPLRI